MGKKLGTSGRIVKRSELKPKRQLSDEALLRTAMRDAEKWQSQLQRQRNT